MYVIKSVAFEGGGTATRSAALSKYYLKFGKKVSSERPDASG
jgi:hypothetical protein